ncbi:hypothetical protein MPNTM1_03451 [Mycolicibacterium parafortuitum]|uniref:hypothetical protein n=1 Tax=Mycolicibacterium parafortuitum TaxID=39692 RepID=UPI0032C43214
MTHERWWLGDEPSEQPRDEPSVEPCDEPSVGTVTIDCDDCAVRGPGCQDCVVSVLLGVPETLQLDEQRALEVLAEVGLAPRLRLVPIHRHGDTGHNTGVA